MLVLVRKLMERIIITTPSGERIAVTPVAIDGKRVRLGFEAAEDVVIDREEIDARKQDSLVATVYGTLPLGEQP